MRKCGDIERKLSQNPIFVVGFPRSGTTLLQSMLATQERIYSLPETHFFSAFLPMLNVDKDGFINSQSLEHATREFNQRPYNEFPIEVTNKILSDSNSINVKTLFEDIVSYYLLQQIAKPQLPEARWVEKTPAHIFHMDKILELYPFAKFVAIIRNPFNSIYSCIQNFPEYTSLSDSYRLAKRWRETIRQLEEFFVQNKNVYIIRYEDIIQAANSEFGKLCEFLDLVPNFEALKDTRNAGKNVIAPWEKWKEKNQSSIMESKIDNYKWPILMKMKLFIIMRRYLITYRYNTGIVNRIMQYLRIDYLNPLIPKSVKMTIKSFFHF